MILGITGGIGSGKSLVSNFFKEKGITILDADIVARELLDTKVVINEMVSVFGEDILDSSGKVNRKKVKDIVFKDKSMLDKINRIIHPKVEEYLEEIKRKNKDFIIFDIPLLFESNLDRLCDKILVVCSDEEKRIERIIKRDNISKELVLKIINSQFNDEIKKEKSDFVIFNNGTKEELYSKADELYNRFVKEGEIKK